MTALRVPLEQGSSAWLEARRDTIGSSDIPVIVGESPYKDRHTLAAEKLGLVSTDVDADTQRRFDLGHLFQPVLLQAYGLVTGRRPRSEHGWRIHREIPWATASLDGTAPVRRIVEAKWSNSARWRDGLPGDVASQVQWQMFVTGWDVADVIVLARGEPQVIEVERDDAMIDDVLWFARDFHGYLERGELPPPDGSDTARRTIAAMHPADREPLAPSTPEFDVLAEELRLAKATAKATAEMQATLENAIRVVIGDAEGVEGAWGRITWKRNADSTRTNWPAVAKAYRALLEDNAAAIGHAALPTQLDAVESIHSETVPGPRVLRTSFKEVPA
jgi:putative phage-type endonuclease